MTDHKDDHIDAQARLRDGIDHARDAASTALETARVKAGDAAHTTVETLEAHPLGVLVGGLVLGAVVAALLPRSRREKELLASVGRKVNAAAAAALDAAKDAGRAELDQLGLTPSAARGQARSVFQGVLKAVSTAGTAAAQAGKDRVKNSG